MIPNTYHIPLTLYPNYRVKEQHTKLAQTGFDWLQPKLDADVMH